MMMIILGYFLSYFCKDDVDFLQLMINAEVDDEGIIKAGGNWTKSRGYYFSCELYIVQYRNGMQL